MPCGGAFLFPTSGGRSALALARLGPGGAFGGSMSPDPAALEAACWRLGVAAVAVLCFPEALSPTENSAVTVLCHIRRDPNTEGNRRGRNT